VQAGRRPEGWAEAKGASLERKLSLRAKPEGGPQGNPEGETVRVGRKLGKNGSRRIELTMKSRRLRFDGLGPDASRSLIQAGLEERRKPIRRQRHRSAAGDESRRSGLGGPVVRLVRGRAGGLA